MRAFAIIVTAAVLIACGQPSASGPSEAAAQPSAGTEDQAAFIARCTREMIAANPESQRWAAGQCEQNWTLVTAAQPWVDAMLAAAAAPGETVAGASLRTRVTQVRWAARSQGALVLQGTLGPTVEAQVDAQNNFNLIWGATGEMIPVDVVEALRVRGVEVAMIGCWRLDTSEYTKAFRVTAPSKAPFALTTYERTAPTANAQSTYSASMGLPGRIQTLAQLRADGSDWSARCPL